MLERDAVIDDSVIGAFDVRRIAVEELDDLDAFIVGLAENADGSGETLLLSTALGVFDAQDRSLSQDTYSISMAWGATVYGGLTGCVLHDELLTLTFDVTAAETLGINRTCRLHLRVADESIEWLKQGLRRVFSAAHTPPAHLHL